MRQDSLFHESIYDALKAIVDRAGGAKDVGARLWPNKPILDARKRLLDCLNPDRDDKLDPEEVLQLLKVGREIGYHGAVNWVLQETGYQQTDPADPADEHAQLQREYIEAVKALQTIIARSDRLGFPNALSRVA